MRGRRLWAVVLVLSVALLAGILLTTGRLGAPEPAYAFREVQPTDHSAPVTWDRCREIVYEVRTAEAPGTTPEARAFVEEALARVTDLTGLRFRAASAENPPVVTIAWATADQVEGLKGTVAGVAGAEVQEIGGRFWYVLGQVFLDADAFEETGFDGEGRAVLLHELGHLVGLGHVDSRRELMYPQGVGREDFGRGDLEGLARLGKGTQSCS